MGALFSLLAAPFRWLPFCCQPGAAAGALVGLMFGMLQLEHGGLVLTGQQLATAGLLLAIPALLLVLFLYGVLLRYGVAPIFWAAVVNVLITAQLTVWINHWLALPAIAAIVGILVGILVGFLLCRLCRVFEPPRPDPKSPETRNG